MIKVLITGANGQLGSEIRKRELAYPDLAFIFTDIEELDITSEKKVVVKLNQIQPDWIINSAAYTAVDRAENDELNALLLNATAPAILAKESKRLGCRLIHVSTDYVFDGKSCKPYKEDDPVNPASVYGKTKLDGEKKCLESNSETLILRTAWLYSAFGNNFVKTMIRLGRERELLNVVFDQVGSPTYGGDLAEAILSIIQKCEKKECNFISGIYHYANEGVCSWYDFALAIHNFSGISTCTVNPIRSEEYPLPTPRPQYSVLDKTKIKRNYHLAIPYWRDSLETCIREILDSE